MSLALPKKCTICSQPLRALIYPPICESCKSMFTSEQLGVIIKLVNSKRGYIMENANKILITAHYGAEEIDGMAVRASYVYGIEGSNSGPYDVEMYLDGHLIHSRQYTNRLDAENAAEDFTLCE